MTEKRIDNPEAKMINSEFQAQLEPTTRKSSSGEPRATPQVKQAQLRVISGSDEGLIKTIPPQGLLIGRSSYCNFVLNDPAVSAKHFRIVPLKTGFLIQDLESSNGTWFHRARMSQICVSRTEHFKVGRSILRLELLMSFDEDSLRSSPQAPRGSIQKRAGIR